MEYRVLTWDSITGVIDEVVIDIEKNTPLEKICAAIDRATSMDETSAHLEDCQCMAIGNVLIIGRRWSGTVQTTVDIVMKGVR